MSIFQELKRRNVFKVGIAYLIAAWLLLQVFSILLPTFNAPEWVMQVFVLLLSTGFLIALFVAWAFELTPEGIKPSTEVNPEDSITPQTGRRFNILIISVLSLAVIVLITGKFVTLTETTLEQAPNTSDYDEEGVVSDRSIAVLPFVNLSSDTEQEYFSDGLTEEILNQLVQASDELRVIARTSSFAFKGVNDDLRLIGETLGVSYLLEGSVRKSELRVRITAQLIRVEDGSHLWSETYDRELNDIFAIQDEISAEVATALSITLDAGEFSLARGGTNNLDAYDAYLRGLEHTNRHGSRADFEQGAEYYQQAVETDPSFLRAWSKLYGELEGLIIYAPDQADRARNEMQQVREYLGETHPDSPIYQGILASWLMDERRWQEAEAVYTANLTQSSFGNRSDQTMTVSTTFNYNTFLWNTGRASEAFGRSIRSIPNDPLSLNSAYLRQIIFYLSGRHEEAEAEYQRGLTLEGDHFNISLMALISNWARSDLSQQEKQEFTSEFHQQFKDAVPDYILEIENAGNAEDKLLVIRQMMVGDSLDSATASLLIAVYASWYGDPVLAAEALYRSYKEYGGTNLSMLWSPGLSEARTQPAFKTLVEEIGFVDYWRATGDWGDFCRPLPDSDTDFECF